MIREIRICTENSRKLSEKLRADIEKKIASTGHKANISFLFFAPLSKDRLGQYSTESFAIFLSETLLDKSSYTQLLSISLHEAAHAVQFTEHGYTAHDNLFRDICNDLGVEDGYEKAKVEVSRQSKVLERIRKLEALSSSPFEAEAQNALLKARRLMTMNSLENSMEESGDSIYETDLFEGGRIYQKQKALARMVQAITGIFAITIHYEEFTGIRGYGSHEELEVASYLWDVLERSIDNELRKRRRENPIFFQGITASANFYLGAASSIIERYSDKKEEAATRQIVLIGERNREKAARIVFAEEHIRTRRSYYTRDDNAYNAGAAFGSKVEIRRPIRQDGRTKLLEN